MKTYTIFKALSDPIRCDILNLLKDKCLNAGELASLLNISPANLSYHLRILKNADLIIEYRKKNFLFYELNITLFDDLLLWISNFRKT